MKRECLISCRASWLVLWALGGLSPNANGQDLSIAPDSLKAPPGSFRAAQELDLSAPSEFISRPAGRHQQLRIDRGYFGNEDPGTSRFEDSRSDSYSGIRFRRPHRY